MPDNLDSEANEMAESKGKTTKKVTEPSLSTEVTVPDILDSEAKEMAKSKDSRADTSDKEGEGEGLIQGTATAVVHYPSPVEKAQTTATIPDSVSKETTQTENPDSEQGY